MPYISICIPAFNAIKFLPETLAAVQKQTLNDWELIVVEDGSDDGTQKFVQEFSLSTKNPVKYIRHDCNKGLPSTRNRGIAAAEGEYIALLDADDLWDPHHLEYLSTLAQRSAVMVHSVSVLFSESIEKPIQKRIPVAGVPIIESLYDGRTIIQPSSVLIHHKILQQIGPFDERFRNGLGEDIDYWLRIASAGFPIQCNGKETCFYRKHLNALSHQSAKLTEGTARVRLKHINAPVFTPQTRKKIASDYFAAAARMQLRGEPRHAKILYWESIKLVPARLDRLLLLILSWIFSKIR